MPLLIKNPWEAKNKSWFGIVESYRLLDGSWTVLSETSRFAQVHLGKLDETAVNHDDDDEGGDDPDAFFKLVSKLPYFFVLTSPPKTQNKIATLSQT